MRILLVTGIYPPDIGGPAVYTKMIAEEFNARGHMVTVVTYADGGESHGKQAPWGGRVYSISRSSFWLFRHIRFFATVFREARKHEVIYAQDPMNTALASWFAGVVWRKKFVVKIIGDYAWEQGMQRFGVTDLLDIFLTKRYGFAVEILRLFERFSAKRASRVIVPSIYLKTVVQKWGVEGKLITVIYNAVSLPDVTYSFEDARRLVHINGYIILSVGRLVPWKGFEMLIRSMPDIQAKIPDAHLLIIGSGPEEAHLKKTVQDLGLEKSVSLLGGKSHSDLVTYISAADIFLLNTGYEGLSHQLIEVMSIGCPIITTDVGGNKEIVRAGDNAVVVGYNDREAWKEAILHIRNNPHIGMNIRNNQKLQNTFPTREEVIIQTLATLQL